jgi:HAMP domain-containing protein
LEYVYGAVPIPAVGPPRGVLRVARAVSSLRGSVSSTLFALRLSTGVAVSAALLLSLGAAIFVSSPLRRMRDAARAFARSEWVPLAPVRTGDELEALAQALVEMGEQMRTRLTAAGASEALLRQAVRALVVPALLLDHDFAALEVSGALRTRGALTPDREAAALAAVIAHGNVQAARAEAASHGNPVELTAPLPGRPANETSPGLLVPLMRPSGAPWWLLLVGLDRDRGEADDARLRALVAAERIIDALWEKAPAQRRELTQLRQAHDEILRLSAPLDADGVQSRQLEAIVAGVLEELRVAAPEVAHRIHLAPPPAALPPIVDALGLAGRAVRSLVRLSLDAARPTVQIEARLGAGGNEVYLALDGGPSIDLAPVRAFCDPVGAHVEWQVAEQTIRLSWPRS